MKRPKLRVGDRVKYRGYKYKGPGTVLAITSVRYKTEEPVWVRVKFDDRPQPAVVPLSWVSLLKPSNGRIMKRSKLFKVGDRVRYTNNRRAGEVFVVCTTGHIQRPYTERLVFVRGADGYSAKVHPSSIELATAKRAKGRKTAGKTKSAARAKATKQPKQKRVTDADIILHLLAIIARLRGTTYGLRHTLDKVHEAVTYYPRSNDTYSEAVLKQLASHEYGGKLPHHSDGLHENARKALVEHVRAAKTAARDPQYRVKVEITNPVVWTEGKTDVSLAT